MPRESAFQRLVRHFHTHPKGRQHEMLFWMGLGVAFGVFGYVGWRVGFLNDAIAMIVGIVATCLFLWAFLPQKKVKERPLPPGKRGEIAKQVRQSKAEKKNKGGVPPGPPIRRG